MPPIVTPYSCEQIISVLSIVSLELLYFSVVYRSAWSSHWNSTGEVSVACMLSSSYEDSINIYCLISRVICRLAQVLLIDLHELHIGVFILILLQINSVFVFVVASFVHSNAEGSQSKANILCVCVTGLGKSA